MFLSFQPGLLCSVVLSYSLHLPLRGKGSSSVSIAMGKVLVNTETRTQVWMAAALAQRPQLPPGVKRMLCLSGSCWARSVSRDIVPLGLSSVIRKDGDPDPRVLRGCWGSAKRRRESPWHRAWHPASSQGGRLLCPDPCALSPSPRGRRQPPRRPSRSTGSVAEWALLGPGSGGAHGTLMRSDTVWEAERCRGG